jgi:hypothetical protein
MSLTSVPDEGSQHFQDRNDHPGEDHADLFLQKKKIKQGKILPLTIISYKKDNKQREENHGDLF